MTGVELYETVYDWFASVITDVPKLRAYTDAQAPASGAYMLIEDNVSWTPYGQVTMGTVNEDDERQLKHESIVTYNFWEVRGVGDRLRTLRAAFDTLAAKATLSAAGISVLSVGPVNQMPELLQTTRWTKQHRMEVTFAVAQLTTETVTNIEEVVFVNNITGGN